MRPTATRSTTTMEMEASRVVMLVRLLILVVAAAMAAVGIVGATAKPAHAFNIFTVNRAGDQNDLDFPNGVFDNLSDGKCDVSLVLGDQCTLRAAIQEANENDNLPGEQDRINFNISGGGVHTIAPGPKPLPFMTQPVIIDGYTQPGAEENTLDKGTNAKLLIELSGANINVENAFGLTFRAPNSVVKGLVINRFDDEGILLTTNSDNNIVEGNFIGTDPTGTDDLGNGALSPADSGVAIAAAAGDNHTIGGDTPAARNLISGNQLHGVEINSDGNRVLNNLIGTDKDGTAPIGNSFDGVRIASDSDHNSVGGQPPGERNTIAFNGSDGVIITSGTDNTVLPNSIFSNGDLNGDLGIDLLGEGPTPNDPGDGDDGPNNLQNKPVLTSAVSSSGTTTIRGRLNSTPNETFTIQFFSNPPGTDEGKLFLGQKSVTTGSDGLVRFRKNISPAVNEGREITATATDSGGNTSEFSAPETVE